MKRISEQVIFLDYFYIFLCENTKMFAYIQTRLARKGSLTVKPFVFLFTHCDGIVEQQIGSIKETICLVPWIRVKVRIDPTGFRIRKRNKRRVLQASIQNCALLVPTVSGLWNELFEYWRLQEARGLNTVKNISDIPVPSRDVTETPCAVII